MLILRYYDLNPDHLRIKCFVICLSHSNILQAHNEVNVICIIQYSMWRLQRYAGFCWWKMKMFQFCTTLNVIMKKSCCICIVVPSQVMLAWARLSCSTEQFTIRGSLMTWIPSFPRRFSPKSRTCRTFSTGYKTEIVRYHLAPGTFQGRPRVIWCRRNLKKVKWLGQLQIEKVKKKN